MLKDLSLAAGFERQTYFMYKTNVRYRAQE